MVTVLCRGHKYKFHAHILSPFFKHITSKQPHVKTRTNPITEMLPYHVDMFKRPYCTVEVSVFTSLQLCKLLYGAEFIYPKYQAVRGKNKFQGQKSNLLGR